MLKEGEGRSGNDTRNNDKRRVKGKIGERELGKLGKGMEGGGNVTRGKGESFKKRMRKK